jgi:hypothetical protein
VIVALILKKLVFFQNSKSIGINFINCKIDNIVGALRNFYQPEMLNEHVQVNFNTEQILIFKVNLIL